MVFNFKIQVGRMDNLNIGWKFIDILQQILEYMSITEYRFWFAFSLQNMQVI